MRLAVLVTLALVALTNGAPAPAAAPTAKLSDGSVLTGGTQGSQVYWYGVRYAAAPVGNLRFAPPKAPPSPAQGPPTSQSNRRRQYGGNNTYAGQNQAEAGQKLWNIEEDPDEQTSVQKGGKVQVQAIDSTTKGPRCPQSGSVSDQDEDCLFMNIQRPASLSNGANVPVLLFFHGGGFQGGSGNDIDPTAFIQAGIDNSQPVLVATINYRLGALGFASGETMEQLRDSTPSNVGLNLGFRDMQRALVWTRANVASFGGDPDRINIWGQSAGAFGVGALLLGNPDSPPFQGALMQSGTPGGPPIDSASTGTKTDQFNRLLDNVGCDQNDSNEGKLSCLRSQTWKTIRKASIQEQSRASSDYIRGSYPWTACIDGGVSRKGFFSDRPSVVLSQGNFAKVNLLSGNNEDEGTPFAPQSFDDEESFGDWYKKIWFEDPDSDEANSAFSDLLQAYPDDPTVGSPYRPKNGDNDNRFFGDTNQFKRAASIYADTRFQSVRRNLLKNYLKKSPKTSIYSYHFANYRDGDADYLGIPHGADLDFVLGRNTQNPSMDAKIAQRWIAFATNGNPNIDGLANWPKYTSKNKQLLQYRDGTSSIVQDDFRVDAMNVLNRDDILALTGR
ncbi:alpha/beta-hydrolase [Acaromyces ingoldii]|uniref:Carboxylic ester hydrolase n=1 Tax=Acaromyces ingoldii TaxID=215250 RepID=A0A316YS62_9BASI|nr:alpha/beta-hydrolase [Acaromyces ingoldii]PWN91962.1 alpha/beta-hydrolase [Acaromyces ingoldii]